MIEWDDGNATGHPAYGTFAAIPSTFVSAQNRLGSGANGFTNDKHLFDWFDEGGNTLE